MDCKTAQQKIMPYIERKLSDREMEEFLEHIRGCRTCSEELEVYFTIYYALENLDKDGQGDYNIEKLLEQDLKKSENKVLKHNIMKFYRRLLAGVFGILAAVFLFTAIQTLYYGSIERTTLYNLFDNDGAQTEEPPHTAPAQEETRAEQETNRKRQVIVRTPETEARQTETQP